jgi:hypothetical protein
VNITNFTLPSPDECARALSVFAYPAIKLIASPAISKMVNNQPIILKGNMFSRNNEVNEKDIIS